MPHLATQMEREIPSSFSSFMWLPSNYGIIKFNQFDPVLLRRNLVPGIQLLSAFFTELLVSHLQLYLGYISPHFFDRGWLPFYKHILRRNSPSNLCFLPRQDTYHISFHLFRSGNASPQRPAITVYLLHAILDVKMSIHAPCYRRMRSCSCTIGHIIISDRRNTSSVIVETHNQYK